MTKNILVKPFVIERIKRHEPDIIVLVEYKFDCNIEQSLHRDYFLGVAIGKNGNDVLIAIKKDIVHKETEPIFNSSVLEDSLSKNQPTVLEATFKTIDLKELSVIGLRYISHGDAMRVSQELNTYLNGMDHDFICTGDFNILAVRMPKHFNNYYHEEYDGKLENSSVIMLNNFKECKIKSFQRLDHVIYSSNIKRKLLTYSWDFVEMSDVYPSYDEIAKGYVWKIPVAYPDHAILECDFYIKNGAKLP